MLKPPEILAPSEAYRAALALAAHGSSGVLRVDEFTSVLPTPATHSIWTELKAGEQGYHRFLESSSVSGNYSR